MNPRQLDFDSELKLAASMEAEHDTPAHHIAARRAAADYLTTYLIRFWGEMLEAAPDEERRAFCQSKLDRVKGKR